MKSLLKMFAIALLCGGTLTASTNGFDDSKKTDSETTKSETVSFKFEAPVELLADGKSIKGIGYPSPNLYDLDGDGKRELVVGDIMGNIFFSKKTSESSVTKWDKTQKLEAAEEPIKLQNW